MSIVISTFEVDSHVQSDGRVYVREVHSDNIGVIYNFEYLADPQADHQAVMTARASQLAQALVDQEVVGILNGTGA